MGASFGAVGYLSVRPLPSGDLAMERVGKNTHPLTTQEQMTGRLKTTGELSMDDLPYTLRQLCKRNRDGDHYTQAGRLRTLVLMRRQ